MAKENEIPDSLKIMTLEELRTLEKQRSDSGEWFRLVTERDKAQDALSEYAQYNRDINRAVTAKLNEALQAKRVSKP